MGDENKLWKFGKEQILHNVKKDNKSVTTIIMFSKDKCK